MRGYDAEARKQASSALGVCKELAPSLRMHVVLVTTRYLFEFTMTNSTIANGTKLFIGASRHIYSAFTLSPKRLALDRPAN